MSLFNIIWVAIFFYYGYLLLFPGIAGVDFGMWDEVIGVLLLVTAVAGLYFIIKTAMKKMSDMSGRFKTARDRRSAESGSGSRRSAPKSGSAPEGFYEDFRSDMVRQKPEQPKVQTPAVPAEEQIETAAAPAQTAEDSPFENESLDESLKRLREEYNLDNF